MGNWGYFTPISGVISPFTTGSSVHLEQIQGFVSSPETVFMFLSKGPKQFAMRSRNLTFQEKHRRHANSAQKNKNMFFFE